jgi:hypothetical protein
MLIGDLRERQDQRGVQQRERRDRDRHANRDAAHDPAREAAGMPEGAQRVAKVLDHVHLLRQL